MIPSRPFQDIKVIVYEDAAVIFFLYCRRILKIPIVCPKFGHKGYGFHRTDRYTQAAADAPVQVILPHAGADGPGRFQHGGEQGEHLCLLLCEKVLENPGF
jgi:hypothetical protein